MRLIAAVAFIAAMPAGASSPAAWAAGDAAARAACIRAAGFAEAHASAPVIFGDATGAKTAMLVTGRYRQRFMKGASGRSLCLYDRRTKHAEASEAKGWTAP